MKLKKIIIILFAVSATMMLSSCSKVQTGYRGVIINLFGRNMSYIHSNDFLNRFSDLLHSLQTH